MIGDPVKVGILQDHSLMNDGISDFQRMSLQNRDLKMTTGTKRTTEMQRLSSGDLKPLASLIDRLALATHFSGDAVIDGADPVIRSPHHLCEASGYVLHISSPAYPDTVAQHLGVDEGKKCAYLDLRETADRETISGLSGGQTSSPTVIVPARIRASG